jgi:hypothetical protein
MFGLADQTLLVIWSCRDPDTTREEASKGSRLTRYDIMNALGPRAGLRNRAVFAWASE